MASEKAKNGIFDAKHIGFPGEMASEKAKNGIFDAKHIGFPGEMASKKAKKQISDAKHRGLMRCLQILMEHMHRKREKPDLRCKRTAKTLKKSDLHN